jgi:hypothetical protein
MYARKEWLSDKMGKWSLQNWKTSVSEATQRCW